MLLQQFLACLCRHLQVPRPLYRHSGLSICDYSKATIPHRFPLAIALVPSSAIPGPSTGPRHTVQNRVSLTLSSQLYPRTSNFSCPRATGALKTPYILWQILIPSLSLASNHHAAGAASRRPKTRRRNLPRLCHCAHSWSSPTQVPYIVPTARLTFDMLLIEPSLG